MSKDEIDYSNTIFYKIYCTDTAVKDLYVGHTTNFVKRKYCHKRSCNNDKDTNHNLKVYKCIRAQGGWKNWKMDIIGFHDCQNHYQARTIEQQYFESLNANLNSISPLPKPKTCIVNDNKILICNVCDIKCNTERQLSIHKNTKKHNKNIERQNEITNKSLEPPKTFSCECCHYMCNKLSEWNKHILTAKHRRLTNNDKNPIKFDCECGKSYKHRQGLHVHKKKCAFITKTESDKSPQNTNHSNLMMQLLNTIQEQQRQLDRKDELIEQMMRKIDIIASNLNVH